jgi:hypothetical protein
MFAKNELTRASLIATAILGFMAVGHADPFSDRLKTDPTAIARPNSTIMPMESEITRSLRAPGEPDPYATPICSYDVYYWNTIYACDPDHQGRPNYSDHGSKDR